MGSYRYIVPGQPISTQGLLGTSPLRDVSTPLMSSIRNRPTLTGILADQVVTGFRRRRRSRLPVVDVRVRS